MHTVYNWADDEVSTMLLAKDIHEGEAVDAADLTREQTYSYTARGRMAGAEIDADGDRSIRGASRRCGSNEGPMGKELWPSANSNTAHQPYLHANTRMILRRRTGRRLLPARAPAIRITPGSRDSGVVVSRPHVLGVEACKARSTTSRSETTL